MTSCVTLKRRSRVAHRVVKQSRVLADLDAEAEIPYEKTRLARRAARARPRLAVLLLAGGAAFLVEGAMARNGWMLLAAPVLAAVAWGAWKGWLGAVVAAAFVALLALFVPIALIAMGGRALGETIALAFVSLWGLILLPDVLTLVRDAELQHAYGRWARRG